MGGWAVPAVVKADKCSLHKTLESVCSFTVLWVSRVLRCVESVTVAFASCWCHSNTNNKQKYCSD